MFCFLFVLLLHFVIFIKFYFSWKQLFLAVWHALFRLPPKNLKNIILGKLSFSLSHILVVTSIAQRWWDRYHPTCSDWNPVLVSVATLMPMVQKPKNIFLFVDTSSVSQVMQWGYYLQIQHSRTPKDFTMAYNNWLLC